MAPTWSRLIFQALLGALLQGAQALSCPMECRQPRCATGAAWNGGQPLVDDVCNHICSRKFGETRYCGGGDNYAKGDSVNCTLCNQKAAAPPEAVTLRIRETILKEARDRLENWYLDQDQMTLPYWESKAKVQQTKHWYLCDSPGGNTKVPITFGEFNVSDLQPAQLFNVLADLPGQVKWDKSISEAKLLKEFRDDGVLAIHMIFPSGIWLVPPREVYEWTAYNASLQKQEYWFAVSSLNPEPMHKEQKPSKFAVQSENCLGAYWIRPCPQGGEKNCPSGNPYECCPEGGSRIIFTSHINAHPPMFVNAKTLFDLGWTRQIDWINALKARAREMLESNDRFLTAESPLTPVFPAWLWQDPAEPQEGSVPFSFPHAMMVAPSKLYLSVPISLGSVHSTTGLFIIASVLIFVALRAQRAIALMKEGTDSREFLVPRGETDLEDN